MKIKKIAVFITLIILTSVVAFAEDKKIRVGINFASSSVKEEVSLSFENGFSLGFLSDSDDFIPFMEFDSNKVKIKAVGNSLSIIEDDGTVLYEASENEDISLNPIFGESEIPYTAIGSIKYPQVLSFSAKDSYITVINTVDAQTYFKGVLPSEVYPSWHEEALKAAAVATRTYTYKSLSGKHSSYGVDLCNTTCCQVYSGITKCKDSTNRAVEETEDLVLTYDGSLITAVYHAISGGVTESASGAWGGSEELYPYLTIVKTPFEKYEEISMGHWKKVLYDEDLQKLKDSSSYKSTLTGDICDIVVDDPNGGYLGNVSLIDSDGNSVLLKTSSQVRSFFSVISANFTIGKTYMPKNEGNLEDEICILSKNGKETLSDISDGLCILTGDGKENITSVKSAYFINGKGYGHGVGMSQYGAQYAAKLGYTFDEILSIYYPGATLTNYSQMN